MGKQVLNSISFIFSPSRWFNAFSRYLIERKHYKSGCISKALGRYLPQLATCLPKAIAFGSKSYLVSLLIVWLIGLGLEVYMENSILKDERLRTTKVV